MQALRRLRRDPVLAIGILLLVTVTGLVLLAPVISPRDPGSLNIAVRLHPPGVNHLLGTDHLGRDLLSRLLFGGRYSLFVSLASVALATFVGVTVGALVGFRGGTLEAVLMRVVDALMTFPTVLIALFIVATLGTGVERIIMALSIATMPEIARVTRAEVLRLREVTYVEAASALGMGEHRIILGHILRNALGPIIVAVTYNFGRVLLAESTLGFLGLGADLATWGQIVGDGRAYMRQAPWAILFGGLAIMLTVLAFNLIGDAFRDAMDPQMARR